MSADDPHPPVVTRERARQWLGMAAALAVGCFIGWLLGRAFGPPPGWLPWAVIACLLAWSERARIRRGWRQWRRGERE